MIAKRTFELASVAVATVKQLPSPWLHNFTIIACHRQFVPLKYAWVGRDGVVELAVPRGGEECCAVWSRWRLQREQMMKLMVEGCDRLSERRRRAAFNHRNANTTTTTQLASSQRNYERWWQLHAAQMIIWLHCQPLTLPDASSHAHVATIQIIQLKI